MFKMAPSTLALPIRTERLVIRDFVGADIEAITTIVTNPAFQGYRVFRRDNSEVDVRSYIEKGIKAQAPDPLNRRELYRLAICLPNDDIIGCCVFDGWSKTCDDQIGYFLSPDHQEQGYATEAMKALLFCYWLQHPDKTVFATVHPSNSDSIKLLRRLGFAESGRTSVDVDGQREPRLIYAGRSEAAHPK